jgi:hypothetical protein
MVIKMEKSKVKDFGKFEEGTLNVTKSVNGKNKKLTINDVQDVFAEMIDNFKGNKNNRFYLRVHGISQGQCYTLKGWDDTELNLDDLEEYLEGKVKDSIKFTEFFKITIGYTKYK